MDHSNIFTCFFFLSFLNILHSIFILFFGHVLCHVWSYSLERKSDVAQSSPTICDPMDYSLPGSSLPGILQARVLEWVAISFSRGSSQPLVSCIEGRFFTVWATREFIDQWNKRESPEINQHTYSQLIYNKGGKNIQWTASSISGTGKTEQPMWK